VGQRSWAQETAAGRRRSNLYQSPAIRQKEKNKTHQAKNTQHPKTLPTETAGNPAPQPKGEGGKEGKKGKKQRGLKTTN